MEIRPLQAEDAPLMCAFFQRNWLHLKPWVPAAAERRKNLAHCTRIVNEQITRQNHGEAASLILLEPDRQRLIATCDLSQISRGAFQACYMGYQIDAQYQGQGLMGPLCQAMIDMAFDELQLHRIMANYMPANNRSARLLKRLGFRIEGMARDYLEINGRWENHMLTALTRANPPINGC